jgi:hypothetical protein
LLRAHHRQGRNIVCHRSLLVVVESFTEYLHSQDPDEHMRLKGSTGTDAHMHYVDDGLQQCYEELQHMQLEMAKELTELAALFAPARSEARYLRLCRRPRYETATFKTISRWAPSPW